MSQLLDNLINNVTYLLLSHEEKMRFATNPNKTEILNRMHAACRYFCTPMNWFFMGRAWGVVICFHYATLRKKSLWCYVSVRQFIGEHSCNLCAIAPISCLYRVTHFVIEFVSIDKKSKSTTQCSKTYNCQLILNLVDATFAFCLNSAAALFTVRVLY